MTYPSISEINMTEGVGTVFVYINDISGGLFINVLLMAVFLIVTVGLFIAQKKGSGEGNFSMCLAVGSFITAIATTILSLQAGLVSQTTQLIVAGITLFSVLFFLFSDKTVGG